MKCKKQSTQNPETDIPRKNRGKVNGKDLFGEK